MLRLVADETVGLCASLNALVRPNGAGLAAWMSDRSSGSGFEAGETSDRKHHRDGCRACMFGDSGLKYGAKAMCDNHAFAGITGVDRQSCNLA